MAFIRLMLAPFAGVECVAKQTGNWPDLREITRGLEPRKGECVRNILSRVTIASKPHTHLLNWSPHRQLNA